MAPFKNLDLKQVRDAVSPRFSVLKNKTFSYSTITDLTDAEKSWFEGNPAFRFVHRSMIYIDATSKYESVILYTE